MSIQSNLCSRLVVSGTLILAVLIAIATTPLHAQEPGVYVGFSLGIHHDVDVEISSSVRSAARSSNLGVQNNVDTSGTPLAFVVGYQVNEIFSVEGRYGQWGDWCVDLAITGTPPSGPPRDDRTISCVDDAAYAVVFARAGFQPIPWLYPYFLAGYQSVAGDSIVTDQSLDGDVRVSSTELGDYEESSVVLGVGVEFIPTEQLGVRVEYRLSEESYGNIDQETSVLGVGLIYRF